jgi:hypothetical protein
VATTISINQSEKDEMAREQAKLLGFPNASADIADVRTYVDEYTKISKEANWERMSMSTALGAVVLDNAYVGATFDDGRYIYYAPYSADTFLRFDSQGQFTTAGNWEQMSMSTAIGAMVNASFMHNIFDGRYIYFSPCNSDTFVRFDTKGTSFTTVADWQKMNMSTAQGGAEEDNDYMGVEFDGRYVYYAPAWSDTLIRFDTQGTSFTTIGDWEKLYLSDVIETIVNNAFRGSTFDGRYIYYIPFGAATFVRFDTQGTSFITINDWQTMSQSIAQSGNALTTAYWGVVYDNKYVYFVPWNSDTFLRVLATPSEL